MYQCSAHLCSLVGRQAFDLTVNNIWWFQFYCARDDKLWGYRKSVLHTFATGCIGITRGGGNPPPRNFLTRTSRPFPMEESFRRWTLKERHGWKEKSEGGGGGCHVVLRHAPSKAAEDSTNISFSHRTTSLSLSISSCSTFPASAVVSEVVVFPCLFTSPFLYPLPLYGNCERRVARLLITRFATVTGSSNSLPTLPPHLYHSIWLPCGHR